MSKIFTRTFRVRWSETNANGWVGPAVYLQYLIETAWDWGAALGFGADQNEEIGLAWVIRETDIHFVQPLRYNDLVDFTIWLIKWRRVRGTRGFEVKLKGNDQVVAYGLQQVASLDGKSMRPVRPPEAFLDSFYIQNPRMFPHQPFPKEFPNEESFHLLQRTVEWQDLDSMGHVNNAIYITYAEEAAAQVLAAKGWSPLELYTQGLAIETRRIHIIYQSVAVWGDRLQTRCVMMDWEPAGGRLYIATERVADGEKIFACLLDWHLVDRVTGAEQPIEQLGLGS